MRSSSSRRGRYGENLAREFLQAQGYHIIAQNFRFGRLGELDFIAFDGNTLVFIEVKYRRSHTFGTPETAITPHKQHQIRRIAQAYLSIHPVQAESYRFDVVAIEQGVTGTEIRLWKNAFW